MDIQRFQTRIVIKFNLKIKDWRGIPSVARGLAAPGMMANGKCPALEDLVVVLHVVHLRLSRNTFSGNGLVKPDGFFGELVGVKV